MKGFNYLFITFLCVLAAFVLMTCQRLALQDSRIRALDDRVRSLEKSPRDEEAATSHTFERYKPRVEDGGMTL